MELFEVAKTVRRHTKGETFTMPLRTQKALMERVNILLRSTTEGARIKKYVGEHSHDDEDEYKPCQYSHVPYGYSPEGNNI